MNHRYVPDAGDIVWLNFDPQAGHEQAGHRPALVISPSAYNDRMGLMLCCPMTTQIKAYPFEVAVAASRNGVVLADQIKSLDWRVRKAIRKGKATAGELAEVRVKICLLVVGAG
ncbi:endoribonuclease MazF [Rugamonas sp.]|uniref:endoribonuclease MazF n=1 Tax=Rugamonas sp. TaxID=1926287 RepID=UPI0025D37006|nr:endoribonuclease MazF [Rugamonas sp.]